MTKKLIGLAVEGAKVIDLCVEGDKLLEEGTGAVYNKNVKGVKVPKGVLNYLPEYTPVRLISEQVSRSQPRYPSTMSSHTFPRSRTSCGLVFGISTNLTTGLYAALRVLKIGSPGHPGFAKR